MASLPAAPNERPEARPDGERTTYDRYREWIEQTPRVLDLLHRKAREYRDRFGRQKIGIGFLTELVRWDVMISTGDGQYKINNNFSSYLVRELIVRDPSLADLFELRASAADRHFNIVRVPGGGVEISNFPGTGDGTDGGLW